MALVSPWPALTLVFPAAVHLGNDIAGDGAVGADRLGEHYKDKFVYKGGGFADLQIWKLRFGHKAKLLFRL